MLFSTDDFTKYLLNISTQGNTPVLGMFLRQWLHLIDINTFVWNVLKML